RRIDAVAQVSKQGFTYVFDRVTGQPVWPIEERPVDTSTDVPGEKPWPTQPFPAKPPAFTPQGVTLEDANDLTPEIKALALEHMKKFRVGPIFTPPSLRGTLMRPSNNGGVNWGGAAFDPETGRLYVKTSNYVYINQVCKHDGSDPRIDAEYHNYCSGIVETRSEEHTSELQSRFDLVCRLLLEKKKNIKNLDLVSCPRERKRTMCVSSHNSDQRIEKQ